MFWWMFGVGRGSGDIGFLALLGTTVGLSGHVREMEMLMPSPSAPLDTGLRRYDLEIRQRDHPTPLDTGLRRYDGLARGMLSSEE